MSKLIEQAGFVKATKTINTPRLIVSEQARGKCGKTHWALTSDQEPILYVNLNKGDEGVIDKFIGKGRDIWRMDLPRGRFLLENLGTDAASKEAEQAWKTFYKGFKKVRKSGGTVILDTATELWELLRLHRFGGKLDQIPAHLYGPVNAEFESIFYLALDEPDLSLIAIHEMKEEYIKAKGEKGGNFTGKYLRSGYKRIEYLAQVLVELYKTGIGEERVYGCRIIECRHDPSVEGMELEGDLCNFPTLRDLVLS